MYFSLLVALLRWAPGYLVPGEAFAISFSLHTLSYSLIYLQSFRTIALTQQTP